MINIPLIKKNLEILIKQVNLINDISNQSDANNVSKKNYIFLFI